LPFTHGLPTVSVMDLALHEREHDLVIGTHGRSAYILDDIRPLRALTPEVMAKKLHLFPIAGAQQHWRAPEAGGFGLGSGEYRGENRPYGAIITFSANLAALPHPDEERARLDKERERDTRLAGETWGPAAAAAAGADARRRSRAGQAEGARGGNPRQRLQRRHAA